MIFLSFFRFLFFSVYNSNGVFVVQFLLLILSEQTGIFGPSEDLSPNACEKYALHNLWTMALIIISGQNLSTFSSKSYSKSYFIEIEPQTKRIIVFFYVSIFIIKRRDIPIILCRG